ncbi:MAG: DUF3857 domain-containing protein [Asticcacaulis sp.]
MSRRKYRSGAIGWLLGLSLFPVMAAAGDRLQFGPPEDWVRPITPASVPREASLAPYAVLNRSLQDYFTDGGSTLYTETLLRIQTPQGLEAAQPTLQWDPVTDTVTVNKALILRDGKVIDLLARGQTFIVMRRETALEKAMLDGELTAALQPDGVQAGDIVDFAYTVKRRIDLLQDRSETALSGAGSEVIGQRLYRFLWPDSKPMRWRLSDDLPPPDIVKHDGLTELTLNFTGYKKPDVPDQAPPRYRRLGVVQFSQFATWQEVSALMAPYYDRAATLSANSPLRDEVAKIAAMSDDPKVRAAAALNLVEEKVRYNAVHGDDAGFMPPQADLTWTRRWADCKGKTALLIALLRQLGITADPALVDLDAAKGDSMHERLPALALFDHIIVRATIGGKVYWLDGTGDADGDLDHLPPALEHWALPVTDAGEDLQPIITPVPAVPDTERVVRLDASAGLDAPASAHVEFIDRGSHAFAAEMTWRTMLPEEQDAMMRAYWKRTYPWIDIDSMSQSFEPETAEMHYVMDGTAHMKWSPSQDGQGRLYETDGYDLISDYKPVKRKPGPHADAPVVVDFPSYEHSSETIVLPDGGKGFSIAGETLDETLAGLELKRRMSIDGGVFTMEAGTRSLAPETPLAAAKAAEKRLETIADGQVFIEAQAGVADAATGARAASGSPAAGAGGDQSVVKGEDALWRDKDGVAAAGKKAALPAPGTAHLSTDDLAELYAGQRRKP